MLISWKWLSEIVGDGIGSVGGPAGLARLLTARGLEVEEVRELGRGFEKVVTARIVSKERHPQADRLSFCRVVAAEGGSEVEIVCGAQNMKAGDVVALAQVGAELPNGMKIAQSKIRGVTSYGMLCSPEELGIEDRVGKVDGILLFPAETPIGSPVASVLDLDDTVLTLKITANRGDCLSHFGIAREVAAALGLELKRPGEDRGVPKGVDFGGSSIALSLEAEDLGPQFWGVEIDGVKVGSSPEWVVSRLQSLGQRSINNVVDATNLLMLELGQPVHAYDRGLIEGGKLKVRLGKAGEKVAVLDGSEIFLGGGELVIGDGADRAMGLAGVMGGSNSEVRPETTRIFLECAEFEPVAVRKAALKHAKRTEAALRFEKGVDPEGQRWAVTRLAQLVLELAGGRVVGSVAAWRPQRDPSTAERRRREIEVEKAFLGDFLGMKVSDPEVKSVFEKAPGFAILEAGGGKTWKVKVPSHRMDLKIREDLAEEVALGLGYDRIGSTLPPLSSIPRALGSNPAAGALSVIDRAKDALAAAGLREALNYGFSSQAWLSKFDLQSTVKVLNPLSLEHECLVPSLIPGLVSNAVHNWNHSFGSEKPAIRLFEIRPTFLASGEGGVRSGVKPGAASDADPTETGVNEVWKFAFLVAGPRLAEGLKADLVETDFSDVKAIVEGVLAALGTKGARWQTPAESTAARLTTSICHPGQVAELWVGKGSVGFLGRLHPGKAKELDLRDSVWVCELDWAGIAGLSRAATEAPLFRPWPEFPPVERDFALVVGEQVQVASLVQAAVKAGKPLAKSAKVFDIYRGHPVPTGMTSVAVRVIFSDETRSLVEAEVEGASSQILKAWERDCGAKLRDF